MADMSSSTFLPARPSPTVGQTGQTAGGPPAFFTVVLDRTAPDAVRTVHPRVHYVFSDDDIDVVGHAAKTPAPARKGGREHVVVVDFEDDGQTIHRAFSLSPEWQITAASTSSLNVNVRGRGHGVDADGRKLIIEGVGHAQHRPPRPAETDGDRLAFESDLDRALSLADMFYDTQERLCQVLALQRDDGVDPDATASTLTARADETVGAEAADAADPAEHLAEPAPAPAAEPAAEHWPAESEASDSETTARAGSDTSASSTSN
ncbi:uncharacterized protein V1510DRAFT_421412, partial [Dipodascopsis tothii]|uniref:uncharacterized protein n=1 Tax=Dipodascopsis tothii TaxID=44089 RepID=UPI0034CEA125